MRCLVCKGAIWKQAHLNLFVCQDCGLVYAKPPGISAELVYDHRHEGLFPVGEPYSPYPSEAEKLWEMCKKEKENESINAID